ncbi:hypothetical protein LEP1GSC126_0044 [Leptospira kirschneri str. 200801774]|uniref:hypothetical protein n=1 Tax=Leptospira kirschneri TaxID=29507 RepID=UPI0002BFAB12|nr:hypothetical protein [Leptospira kirschneri]EMO78609.1 hypothetical protein LEP1GSC126_0044 [Leptospira kirschneri str. 200801774]
MTHKLKKAKDEFRKPSLIIFIFASVIEAVLQYTDKAKQMALIGGVEYTVFGAIALLSISAYLSKPLSVAWASFKSAKPVEDKTDETTP